MGAFTLLPRLLRQSGLPTQIRSSAALANASQTLERSLPYVNQFRYQTRRTLILQPFFECVQLASLSDSDKGIVEVRLDRPEAKNAIGKEMLMGLNHHLQSISNDASVNVLLLRSSVPKVFCAGADLKERRSMSASEVHSFVNSLRSTFSFLEELQVPTIAVIEGAALGGGLEMALSCDIRICGENAIMGLPETGLAIIPGAGGTQRLPRLVGKSIAKELIFTGRRVGGREALTLGTSFLGLVNLFPSDKTFITLNDNLTLDCDFVYSTGLVNYCAPAGEAHVKALEIARNINEKGPLALRMAKRAINKGLESDMEAGLQLEEDCYSQLLDTKDRLEGLAAFAEKRKAVYKGE